MSWKMYLTACFQINNKFFPVLPILMGSVFSNPVLAQAPDGLETIVVTESPTKYNSFDTPASLNIVVPSRKDNVGVNASEVLGVVPGLVVRNRQNYAQDLQISSRGFGARAGFGIRGIRLIADGIPASMPDGQGQAASINLDRAERIEVIRGPMAAIYGNQPGGSIQFFTQEGRGAPNLEVIASTGSYATWKTDVAGHGQNYGIGYLLDVSHFDTKGFRDHSTVHRDQQLAKFTSQPCTDCKLRLIASGFQQQAEDPLGQTWDEVHTSPRSAAFSAFQFNTGKSVYQRQGSLGYEQRFGEQSVLLSTYTGQRNTIQYQAIPISAQLSPNHSGGIIDFDRNYSGLSTRWTSRNSMSGGNLTTTAGLEYEECRDDRRGYANYIGASTGIKGALRRNEIDVVNSVGQYAQTEWQGEDWILSIGIRRSSISFQVEDKFLDNGNDSGQVRYTNTTPTFAALYHLSPSTNLYGSATRGFEAPTFNELFYSGPGGSFSYDLKPATGRHLEVGIKHFLAEQQRMDLALYQINTTNELVVDSSAGGRTSYRNAAQTFRRGLELSIDSHLTYSLQSRVALSIFQATFNQDFYSNGSLIQAGKHLPGIADRNFNMELLWQRPGSGLHAGIEATAQSHVYVENTNQVQAAPGYAVVNLHAGYEKQLGELSLRAFVRINNILNNQYIGSVVVADSSRRYYEASPGRNWVVGLSIKYKI